MLSYYVCGAFMYIIYVSYMYVLDYNTIPISLYIIVQYIYIRYVYNVHKCSTNIIGYHKPTYYYSYIHITTFIPCTYPQLP